MRKKDQKLTRAEIQKIVDEKSKSKEVVEKYKESRKKRGKQTQELYSDAEFKEDFWNFIKGFFQL